MSRRPIKALWLTTCTKYVDPVVYSIECTDLNVLNDCYVYDYEGVNSECLGEALLAELSYHNSDVVFYIGTPCGPNIPEELVFRTIRKSCPLVHVVFDGGSPEWWPLLKHYRESNLFDLTVNIDGSHDWPKGDGDITILCPIDTSYYAGPPVEKDIPVGFYGGNTHPLRPITTGYLLERGLLTVPAQVEQCYEPYAQFMRRCRIVLNMAHTGAGTNMHVKARVIEAGLAGACLLEPKGSPLTRWMKPGHDYVEYSSLEHLVACIKGLLANKGLRPVEHYAANLSKRVTNEYSPDIFYRKIFERLGWEKWKL